MVVESKPDSGAKTARLAPFAPNASRVRASVSGPDPGACGDFHIGHGGFCDDLHDGSSGPTGYWCSQSPPRGPSSPDTCQYERVLEYLSRYGIR